MTALRLRAENAFACSVLICAYNAEATIREAVESAQAQTLPNIEIIVVDDGSSDQTAAVVDALARNDRRIHLITQPNAGVAAARNRAIEQARGVVIAFLDADDRWRADHLQRHVEVLATTDVEITFARARFIDAEGLPTGDRSRPYRERITPSHLLSGNPCTTCSTMVILRSVFAQVGAFDVGLRRSEDQEWLLRAALNGSKIVGTGETSVDYRNSPRGLSADLDQMLSAFRQVLLRAKGYAPHLVAREASQAEANLRLYLARRAVRLGLRNSVALDHLQQAYLAFPRVVLISPLRIVATLAGMVVPRLTTLLARSRLRAGWT